jgi:hypothetical protein
VFLSWNATLDDLSDFYGTGLFAATSHDTLKHSEDCVDGWMTCLKCPYDDRRRAPLIVGQR